MEMGQQYVSLKSSLTDWCKPTVFGYKASGLSITHNDSSEVSSKSD